MSHLLLPNELTPQAFVAELVPRLREDYASLPPEAKLAEEKRLALVGQRGWFYEEFGTKVRAMMRDGSTMASFRGLLRKFDDNVPLF